MSAALLLVLMSIPFATIVLRTAKFNQDVFVVLYVSSLGLILSSILLASGFYLTPLMSVIAEPAHR